MTLDMTLVLMSLGTLVTAIAALFTILEMRRQRQAHYKPEFVCEALRFAVRPSKDEQAVLPLRLASPGPEPATAEAFSVSQLFVTCLNIGLGPAKSVSYRWTFDAQSAVESLARAGVDVFEIWLEGNLLLIGGSTPKLVHNLSAQTSGFRPVVHSHAADNSLLIPMPSAYLDLLALSFVRMPARADSTPRLVPLDLELSYRDIEDKAHSRRFILTPELAMMSYRAVAGMAAELQYAEGHFNVREE